ncbi:MAG: hypothetical protein JJU29_08580 [Verrucomicrobia bacterium]|nr:hypothetical protein [Verrucomicrobiota bacterium]MCH8512950.1 hypothetical protein [Kiritimatiellia bacterium]
MTENPPIAFPTLAGERAFPAFDLCKLLRTVFNPIEGCKVAILIDLPDPVLAKDFAFLRAEGHPVQKKAYEVFYQGLQNGGMAKLGLSGGELFAYETTGGSNLDLPENAVGTDGKIVNLANDVYTPYDLILCISDYSATAPLTAHAKTYNFRGSTMHGLNDIIISSGLAVDYREVSSDAEKMRLGLTKADKVEIDFVVGAEKCTLTLILNGQEAQKSHGLCHGRAPDIANLPAGEVYFVPEGAFGKFPMKYEEDGTLAIQHVMDGRIFDLEFISGNPETVEAHRLKLATDPVTGEIGELGLGTQVLPYSGADIQDEKTLGTVHVATGRSDHLGGHLVPGMFAEAKNASHDDILFHPNKTPEIKVPEVRWYKGDRTEVIIENYRPSAYITGLLNDSGLV